MSVTDAPDDFARLQQGLVDRYEIVRELGRGGMSYVFLARDLRHHRQVAIKVLRPELASIVGAERFIREIRLTAALQHPHILPLFDSGEVGGFVYAVMPYIEGETLRQRLERERQLPIGDALDMIRSLADALEYAHQHGVIHRDIKPENILLQHGHPLLADFGIAFALDQTDIQRLTITGMSVGTPQYMSPEQATGERAVGAQSDIYSLAAVAYETLVGEAPITGPSHKALVARLLTEAPRPIRTVRESVPAAAEAAILRALAKLPADRYRTAAEFARALTSASAAGTPDALPVDRSHRRRLRWLAAAALVAIILLGGWWGGKGRMRAAEAATLRRVALLPCVSDSTTPGTGAVADQWSEELIRKLVKVGGLSPKAWVSVARYKNSPLRVREIGTELNAGTLVRCRVAEQADSAHLYVELIHARDEQSIWSDDYRRPATAQGINAAQTAAARAIARRLGVEIAPRSGEALERTVTSDSAALRHYRLGRYFLMLREGLEARRKSVEHFRSAIARDSSFAQAYVGLAFATLFLADVESRPSREFMPEIAHLLKTAVSLDPDIAEAYTQLGLYYLHHVHDWRQAEEAHNQAILIDPSSVEVRWWYGWHLQVTERPAEAIREYERAIDLDPTSTLPRAQLVRALIFSGNRTRALRESAAALDIESDWASLYHHVATMMMLEGQRDSAIAILDRHVPTPQWWDQWLYAAAGRRDGPQHLLDSLVAIDKIQPVDPLPIAVLHAGLGNREEALTWLERGYAERSGALLFFLGPHPAFNAMRGDPRFRELRRKAGFKE